MLNNALTNEVRIEESWLLLNLGCSGSAYFFCHCRGAAAKENPTDRLSSWESYSRHVPHRRHADVDYIDNVSDLLAFIRQGRGSEAEMIDLLEKVEHVLDAWLRPKKNSPLWTVENAIKRLANAVQYEINGFNDAEGELEDLQAIGKWLLQRGTELTPGEL